jgi:hypothetical protein
MALQIQRYACTDDYIHPGGYGAPKMEEDADGDYVKWADVAPYVQRIVMPLSCKECPDPCGVASNFKRDYCFARLWRYYIHL